jgi:flagellar biosynthetic protein FliP
MVTSFTRLVIALSFLRSGLGLQSTPANLVLVSLALFMTFFIMSPVFDKAKTEGLDPYMKKEISDVEAYTRITAPFRSFMLKNVREKDLALFQSIAEQRNIVVDRDGEMDLRILVPAFMISELRRGFEIGFLIALPFLVIDLIVAMLTMSMGMMMLPPTVISLPFKVLFFVLIDGWNLLVGSLINSFIIV